MERGEEENGNGDAVNAVANPPPPSPALSVLSPPRLLLPSLLFQLSLLSLLLSLRWSWNPRLVLLLVPPGPHGDAKEEEEEEEAEDDDDVQPLPSPFCRCGDGITIDLIPLSPSLLPESLPRVGWRGGVNNLRKSSPLEPWLFPSPIATPWWLLFSTPTPRADDSECKRFAEAPRAGEAATACVLCLSACLSRKEPPLRRAEERPPSPTVSNSPTPILAPPELYRRQSQVTPRGEDAADNGWL